VLAGPACGGRDTRQFAETTAAPSRHHGEEGEAFGVVGARIMLRICDGTNEDMPHEREGCRFRLAALRRISTNCLCRRGSYVEMAEYAIVKCGIDALTPCLFLVSGESLEVHRSRTWDAIIGPGLS